MDTTCRSVVDIGVIFGRELELQNVTVVIEHLPVDTLTYSWPVNAKLVYDPFPIYKWKIII